MNITSVSFTLSQSDFVLLLGDGGGGSTLKFSIKSSAPACTVNSYLFLRWLREQSDAERIVRNLFKKDDAKASLAKKEMETQVLCRLFEQGTKLWVAAIKQKTIFQDLEAFFGNNIGSGSPVHARFLSNTQEYYAMVYNTLTKRFDHPDYLWTDHTNNDVPDIFVGPKGQADFSNSTREQSHMLLDVQDITRFLGPNLCPQCPGEMVDQQVTSTEHSERVGSVITLQKVLRLHNEMAVLLLTTEDQRNTLFTRGNVWTEMLRLYARSTVTMLQMTNQKEFNSMHYEKDPSARKCLRKQVYVKVSNQQMLPEDHCMIKSNQWDRSRHFVEMLLNSMYSDKYLLPQRVQSLLFMMQQLDPHQTKSHCVTDLQPLRILVNTLARYGPSPISVDTHHLETDIESLLERQLIWKSFVNKDLWPAIVQCFDSVSCDRDQFHQVCQTLFNTHNMAANSCFADDARSVHTEHMKLARAMVLDWWFLTTFLTDTLLLKSEELRKSNRSCVLNIKCCEGLSRVSLVHTEDILREKETLQNTNMLSEMLHGTMGNLSPLCYGSDNGQLFVQWGSCKDGTLGQDIAPFYWSTVLEPIRSDMDRTGLLITYDNKSIALCAMPGQEGHFLLFDPHMESNGSGCSMTLIDACSDDFLQKFLHLIRSTSGQYKVTRVL